MVLCLKAWKSRSLPGIFFYMKILITGCFGFIGINFIQLLKNNNRDNINIIGVDKLTYASNKKYIKEINKLNFFKFYKADINSKKIRDIIFEEKPDFIINFAAESHVDNSISSADEFIKSNINGVYNLLKYSLNYYKKLNSKQKKIFKFIQISTDEVYGSLLKGSANEKNKYLPSSPYSASKAAANHLVNAWQITYDLPTIITYCSNNYGPFQNKEKLIPKVIDCINKNKRIPVYGDGKNVREWIYVEDHASAIFEILMNGKIGQSYNIGTNTKISNLIIIDTIIKEYVKIKNIKNTSKIKSLIKFVEDRLGHDFRYSLNSNKIKNDLNWSPKTSFSKGISKTVKWYLDSE